MLEDSEFAKVWFKQDDKFDQPLIWAKARITTTDNSFPFEKNARCFLTLWITMLNESLRETTYMAQLGDNHYHLMEGYDSVVLQFHAYNDPNYLMAAQSILEQFKSFAPEAQNF